MRGPEMQLSLYHQLVSNMVNGKVDIGRLYSELELDAEGLFSDGFLAEAGNMYSNAELMDFDTLLENNTLDVRVFSIMLMRETMATCSKRIIPFTRLFKPRNGNCGRSLKRI